MSDGRHVLGPCVGAVTSTSAKVWIYAEPKDGTPVTVWISVTPAPTTPTTTPTTPTTTPTQTLRVDLHEAGNYAGVAHFSGLTPACVYEYALWLDVDATRPLPLGGGIERAHLRFTTLPELGLDDRLDFIVVSCNNPDVGKKLDDGADGFGVWRTLNQVVDANKDIAFALLAGDQVYADGVEGAVLRQRDEKKQAALYRAVYRRHWKSEHFRRLLARLPSYSMWDDHDITDGWGSREDSYVRGRDDAGHKRTEFKPQWLRLFEAAKRVFWSMQASRNPSEKPDDVAKDGPFDCCFKIGGSAFVMCDLRSKRNVRATQIWSAEQMSAVQAWVAAQDDVDTLFFVTPVVFAHSDPGTDTWLVSVWWIALKLLAIARLVPFLRAAVRRINRGIGDIRDDINDGWSSDANRARAREVLEWLFGLQNRAERPIRVVMVSGDIHLAGWANLYSANDAHKERPVIPHIVSSPVAYKPTSWIFEALYRSLTKTVDITGHGQFYSQISHHFSHRSAAVLSLRRYGEARQLKVKFYLEGFAEPQTLLFDLDRGTHRENVTWETNA